MWMTLWILAMRNLPRLSKGCVVVSSRYPARSYFQIVSRTTAFSIRLDHSWNLRPIHKFHFASRGWPPSDDLEYHHPPLFLINPPLCYSDSYHGRKGNCVCFFAVFMQSQFRMYIGYATSCSPGVWGGYLLVELRAATSPLRSGDFFVPQTFPLFLLGCMGMLLL
jgi:hypothetical protein